MQEFSDFIEDIDLDAAILRKKFTRFCSDGVSMSKLDRFFMLENLWEVQGRWVGKRDIANHIEKT